MQRRDVMKLLGGPCLVAFASSCSTMSSSNATTNQVMTVTGPISASSLGLTLAHEHLFADLRSFAEQAAAPFVPDTPEIVAIVLPHLQRLRATGCQTLVDATATHLGRNPALLKRLSVMSGLQIITVTGVYLAADQRFVPPYARTNSPEALAERWIGEWENGIDGSGVRPGLIKLGVDGGPLKEIELKALTAAAITHLRTGLSIAVHTSPWRASTPGENARSAIEQLDLLATAGVDESAWIWMHAQNETQSESHVIVARRGAFVSFDGYRPGAEAEYIRLVQRMRSHGLLGQVLLSQDAGWYTAGQPRGGDFAPLDPMMDRFTPALKAAGFDASEIDTLFRANPAKALAVRVRPS